MYLEERIDLICFSPLRWADAYQRQHQLMTRFSRKFRVIYIEEPSFTEQGTGYATSAEENFICVQPHFHINMPEQNLADARRFLLEEIFTDLNISKYIAWFHTPTAVAYIEQLTPVLTVYDCVGDLPTLANFTELESKLLQYADVVFTDGLSLYESKKHFHSSVHAIPDGIDIDHFYKGRYYAKDPLDQVLIPLPRIGFFGTIDNRVDLTLLSAIALRKPEWSFVLIGDTKNKQTPALKNVHFLGEKTYEQLPAYLSGWDLTMLPLVHNESTRFLNPRQSGAYLAAGKPVISTAINDVIRLLGRRQLVNIAGTADEFIRIADIELRRRDRTEWSMEVNDLLQQSTWEKTWQRMDNLISEQLTSKVDDMIKKVFAS